MMNVNQEQKEYEESFGVIVFRKDSPTREVLLVRQSNHWGFPKGHAEIGEDGLAAALREVKEETDVSVTVTDPSKFLIEEYEIRRERFTTKKTVTYWIGEGDGMPHPKEDEILEARWATIHEVLELLTYTSAKNLLKTLI
jgi:ADP-ribose pyrophosphatase YjhB (NUDIX family)